MIGNIFSFGRKDDDDDLVTDSATGGIGSSSGIGSSIPYPPYRPGIPVNTPGPTAAVVELPAPMDINVRSPPTSPTENEVDKADPAITIDLPIDFENGLPMIPKAEPPAALPSGIRSLYISVLRRSDHIRIHHQLKVRDDMTDKELFKLIRDGYETHLLGFWRRWLALKGLKSIQILECVDNKQPTRVELDDFVVQEIMFAYSNPAKITSKRDWVNWAFRLKQKDKRFALDFVEGWQGSRIITFGLVPWIASFLMTIVWSLDGGDLKTVFTVASFVLAAATCLLALLAIVSALES